jgi:hydrogenase nickel incorporation protein HypA/HybF
MNEMDLSAQLVTAVCDEMRQRHLAPNCLSRVRVVIGILRQVNEKYLILAYDLLTCDTPANGSVLEIIRHPANAICAHCGWLSEVRHASSICAQCGTPEMTVPGCKDVYVDELKVAEGMANQSISEPDTRECQRDETRVFMRLMPSYASFNV